MIQDDERQKQNLGELWARDPDGPVAGAPAPRFKLILAVFCTIGIAVLIGFIFYVIQWMNLLISLKTQ